MSNALRILRQTLTIARRDFSATVLTPTFLLFLLAPIIMLSFGVVGGGAAASMAGSGEDRLRLVVIAPPAEAAPLVAVDRQMRALFSPRGEDRLALLEIRAPAGDAATQARALFDAQDIEVAAVLHGPLEKPQILYGPRYRRGAEYLAQLAEQTLRAERTGTKAPLSTATRTMVTREQTSPSGRGQIGFFGVFSLFFLTLLLSGQAVGTMAEEKSNKVIEILAAAVPLESVFLGKLIGMFGVALLFLLFWGTILGNLAQFVPIHIFRALFEMGPAVGNPAFLLLFFAYFAMAYMLLGAVFLGVGAQAGTQREIQMLSLPITIFQVGMFGLASAAASQPDGWLATVAEIFPFSSPFAMIGRAANSPELWPHVAALAWQALWVAITVAIGARLFRRGVLKSGSPKLSLRALFGR